CADFSSCQTRPSPYGPVPAAARARARRAWSARKLLACLAERKAAIPWNLRSLENSEGRDARISRGAKSPPGSIEQCSPEDQGRDRIPSPSGTQCLSPVRAKGEAPAQQDWPARS